MSLLGLSDIHQALRQFKSDQLDQRKGERSQAALNGSEASQPSHSETADEPPFYYMVKVDFKGCFDSIPHEKLLSIFEKVSYVEKENTVMTNFTEGEKSSCYNEAILASDAYLIFKYATLDLATGQKRFHRGCQPISNVMSSSSRGNLASRESILTKQSFSALINSLENKKHCKNDQRIFVDQVIYSIEYRRDLLKLLRNHVTKHFVQIQGNTKLPKKHTGNMAREASRESTCKLGHLEGQAEGNPGQATCIYRQKIGIPQGSVVSSLLCSFFYADMDQTHLTPFLERSDTVNH